MAVEYPQPAFEVDDFHVRIALAPADLLMRSACFEEEAESIGFKVFWGFGTGERRREKVAAGRRGGTSVVRHRAGDRCGVGGERWENGGGEWTTCCSMGPNKSESDAGERPCEDAAWSGSKQASTMSILAKRTLFHPKHTTLNHCTSCSVAVSSNFALSSTFNKGRQAGMLPLQAPPPLTQSPRKHLRPLLHIFPPPLPLGLGFLQTGESVLQFILLLLM